MANSRKRGLGKGLGALIPSDFDAGGKEGAAAPEPEQGEKLLYIDPQTLKKNPRQPRLGFSEEGLEELAESIKRDGVQDPVIVRNRDGAYELVSGERRARAAVMAGLDAIPAICRDISDDDMLRLGLIENIQRENLNAIEIAKAYQALVDEFDWTQEELADQVGKKRATVANALRLLSLPKDVQENVANGAISMGHARALLALSSAAAQSAACRRIIKEGLSVRQTERLAAATPKPGKQSSAQDPHIAAIEDELRQFLGTRVALRHSQRQRGRIEIEYYSLDELNRILGLLRGPS